MTSVSCSTDVAPRASLLAVLASLATSSGCGFSVFDGLSSDFDAVDSADESGDGAVEDGGDTGGCAGAECGPPSCRNDMQDETESDVDCGGDECTACAPSATCNGPRDCETGVCGADGLCAEASCSDETQNGEESDIDCGGNDDCDRCQVDRTCGQPSDCLEGVCQDGTCQAASCSDATQNGDETATDCGGACAPEQRCAAGLACLRDDDCTLPYCLDQTCRAPHGSSVAWPLPGQIEAEAYDEGGEGIGYHDGTPGNTGGAHRADDVDLEPTTDPGGGFDVTLTSAGEWLAYTVAVDADASDYNVELRVAARDAEGLLHLSLDGGELGSGFVVPRTAGNQRFVTVERNGVALPSGVHLLQLAHDEDGANVNWLRVSRAQAPYGAVAWPVPGTIEAENFDVGGEGVAYHAAPGQNPPFLHRVTDVDVEACSDAGDGFDVTAMRGGDWLEYTVDVQSAGSYLLEARVATTLANQTVHVELDGASLTGELDVATSESFQTFETLSAPGLSLSKGTHILRFVFDTGFVNLNWLRLTAQ